MARQYSNAVRDGKRQSFEATVGTSPKFRILTGAPPSNCAAAQTGTLLAEIDLPADWLNHAGTGTSTKAGTWDALGIAAGTAGYYRIVNNAGTVCHEQGTIGTSGTDAIVDNDNIAVGQGVTVVVYTVTEGNQ